MNENFINKTIQEFKLIFDTELNVMVTIRLNDAVIIDVSKEFANILGYTPDELMGRSCKEINLYETPANHNRLLNKIGVEGSNSFRELIFRRKDGSFFTSSMSSQIIMLSTGENISDNVTKPKSAEEKDKTANELKEKVQELVFQTQEKADRAAELVMANRELAFQNEEKDKRAAELIIANKELTFQTREKADRAAELVIANRELAFQNEEKDKRAAELIIANKELTFQTREKSDRAAELVMANRELAFQNEEKDKRAAELIIANKELTFQTREKADRAAELVIANKELVFQNEEKNKRAAELILANKELASQNKEIVYLIFHDQLTGVYNRKVYEKELERLDTADNLPLTIIVGDVKGLKQINDSFGPTMGDELLRKSAEIIKKSCRKKDVITRTDSDEFIILMPKTNASEAEAIIQRMNDLSSQEKAGPSDISISFGYETKQNEEDEIQEVFKQADEYMYKDKSFKVRAQHKDI
ncbi:diguanylate cyclase/phosphodiesterase [Planococcus antarcticus DSM 14505]|uniref:Diguanylate cyclase/phosphodiesterase n=1 Tax=Planococcus antarcticus DSM 14505 TaxID=1185653 RepID=A0AA87IJ68_9BACL|nr:sensor domain-containing diguanylate cyclase [Planococcus antarcticus]EIM05417.1 diguanylate cyclase/phosphodiesterase [Planococcus antarcticus DSM 14505]